MTKFGRFVLLLAVALGGVFAAALVFLGCCCFFMFSLVFFGYPWIARPNPDWGRLADGQKMLG